MKFNELTYLDYSLILSADLPMPTNQAMLDSLPEDWRTLGERAQQRAAIKNQMIAELSEWKYNGISVDLTNPKFQNNVKAVAALVANDDSANVPTLSTGLSEPVSFNGPDDFRTFYSAGMAFNSAAVERYRDRVAKL